MAATATTGATGRAAAVMGATGMVGTAEAEMDAATGMIVTDAADVMVMAVTDGAVMAAVIVPRAVMCPATVGVPAQAVPARCRPIRAAAVMAAETGMAETVTDAAAGMVVMAGAAEAGAPERKPAPQPERLLPSSRVIRVPAVIRAVMAVDAGPAPVAEHPL